MSYEVGSHIDLRHLNKKKGRATVPKKSSQSTAHKLYIVGTKFVFKITPSGFQAAIQIPVAYG